MSPKEFVRFSRKRMRQEDDREPRLIVTAEAMEFIKHTAAVSPTVETGGILMGFHNGADIKVVKATDAGPGARRSSCGFLRDSEYCQKILNEEFKRSGADYVGEWHTHVIDLPRPSGGDLTTLAAIILDPEYNFPSFAMLLGVLRNEVTDVLSYIVVANASDGDPRRRIVTVREVIAASADNDESSEEGPSKECR